MPTLHGTLLKAAGLLLALTTAVAAQDYPNKPVRLIIPFPPGGSNDVVGRLIATHLSERLGKQVVVDNRGAGAGGVVGSEVAANAPRDGYTLLIISLAHAVNPWLYKLSYDPAKAFAPISPFMSSQNALAVNNDLPVKSLQEFIALAKSQPGKIQYASGGVGGALHLAMEMFKFTAGIDLLHVPFRGAGPGIIDVVGGHTKAINATIATLSPHIRGGKLRALGVSGAKRSPVLPDVPTIEEGGVPGYDAGNWYGIAAPAGTPDAIIAKLHKEISGIQDLPAIQRQVANDGADIVRMSPIEFAAYMESEMSKWGRVIQQAGIKAQ
jgi:tripartite-type tricarboxylate transporter receptor subunit TctC